MKFLNTQIWEGVSPGRSLCSRIKVDPCQLPRVISLDVLSLMRDEYTSGESKRMKKKAITTMSSLQKNASCGLIKNPCPLPLVPGKEFLKPMEFLDKSIFWYPFFRIWFSRFIRKYLTCQVLSSKHQKKK